MVPPGGAEGYRVKSGLRNGNVRKRSPWETVLPRFTDARHSSTDQPGSRTAGRARPGLPGYTLDFPPSRSGIHPIIPPVVVTPPCRLERDARGCRPLATAAFRRSAPRSHDEEEARHPQVNGRLLRAASGVGASGRLSQKGEGAIGRAPSLSAVSVLGASSCVADRNPLPVRARRGRRSARHVPRAVEAYARTDGEARRGVPCGRDARPPRRGALRRDDPPSAWQRHRPGDERGTPGRAAFWASAPGVDLTRRAVCGRTRARFVDRCSVASPPLATALSRPSRLVAQGRRPRVPGPAPVQAVIAARIDRLREGGAAPGAQPAAPTVIRAGSPRIGGS